MTTFMEERRTFLIWGAILFFIGLITGFLLAFVTNPRMGLAAHLAAVQGGMALIIFGVMWGHVRRNETGRKVAMRLSIYSMYATWAGLLLSAVWGTKSLIAGSAFQGTTGQEVTVMILTLTGALSIVVAMVIILLGLFQDKREAGI
jgi:(hydroxyamino)benzene mutase